jgi:hypothetical protein
MVLQCCCSNGDVAWEAQVSSSSLAGIGYAWDAESHSLVPLRPDNSSSSAPNTGNPDGLTPQDSASSNRDPTQQQHQQQFETVGGVAVGANGLMAGIQTLLRVSTAAAGGSFDHAARGAAAPAGETEPATGEALLKPAAAAAAGAGGGVEQVASMHGRPVPTKVGAAHC